MSAMTIVRTRIDGRVKAEAAKVLDDIGLSVSDVVRMVLTRVADEQALPLDLKVPNAETKAAMQEARAAMKQRSARFSDPQAMFDALAQDAERR